MRLAGCVIGFGRGTTGGAGGRYYVVTDDGDDATDLAPGTLRYGVIQVLQIY
jgi:pectate lyase